MLSTLPGTQQNAIYGSRFYSWLQDSVQDPWFILPKKLLAGSQELGTVKSNWFLSGSDINKLDDAPASHLKIFLIRTPRIYPHKGTVFSHKKECSTETCYDTDDP